MPCTARDPNLYTFKFPWNPTHIDLKHTGAHSTRQRITRQCVWSQAVLPVVLSQRATQISDKRALIKGKRRQTQTDVRARAEHRMTTTHSSHERALSFHRRAPTVSRHLRSQSSGCTDHPPASPIHYCCDAHSLWLFAPDNGIAIPVPSRPS